jgi:hypothetical protein
VDAAGNNAKPTAFLETVRGALDQHAVLDRQVGAAAILPQEKKRLRAQLQSASRHARAGARRAAASDLAAFIGSVNSVTNAPPAWARAAARAISVLG